MYEGLWGKIIDFINSITNSLRNSDNCNEKYTTTKFNSYDDLPLKKKLELYNLIIVVRSAFYEAINTIRKFS